MVALKEIRLNSEEGTPFTAIREGKCLYVSIAYYTCVVFVLLVMIDSSFYSFTFERFKAF